MTADEFVAMIETLLVEADKGVPTVRELIEVRKRVVAAIAPAAVVTTRKPPRRIGQPWHLTAFDYNATAR